jgi:hypothetical protein
MKDQTACVKRASLQGSPSIECRSAAPEFRD